MGNTIRRQPVTFDIPDAPDYKYLNITDFRGLHQSDNPFVVNPNTASDCLNVYVDENNALSTRPRLEEKLKFETPLIDSFISVYNLFDGYLVHGLTNDNIGVLYRVSSNGTEHLIAEGTATVPIAKVCVFEQDGRIYLAGAGQYSFIENDELDSVVGYVPERRVQSTTLSGDTVWTDLEPLNAFSDEYKDIVYWDGVKNTIPTETIDVEVVNDAFEKLPDMPKEMADYVLADQGSLPSAGWNAAKPYFDGSILGYRSSSYGSPFIEAHTLFYIWFDKINREWRMITRTIPASIGEPMAYMVPDKKRLFLSAGNGTYVCDVVDDGFVIEQITTASYLTVVSNLGHHLAYDDSNGNRHLYYVDNNRVFTDKGVFSITQSTGEAGALFIDDTTGYGVVEVVQGNRAYDSVLYGFDANTLEISTDALFDGQKVSTSGALNHYDILKWVPGTNAIQIPTSDKSSIVVYNMIGLTTADTKTINFPRRFASSPGFTGVSNNILGLTSDFETRYELTRNEDTHKITTFVGATAKGSDYYDAKIKLEDVDEMFDEFSVVMPEYLLCLVTASSITVYLKKQSPQVSIVKKLSVTDSIWDNYIASKEAILNAKLVTRFQNNVWFASGNVTVRTINNDPTYIGVNTLNYNGEAESEITGFNLLSDTSMVAYKKDRLYLISYGEVLDNVYDYIYTETKNTVGNNAFGATIVTTLTETPLQISYDGVFTLNQLKNVQSNDRICVSLTEAINKKWLSESDALIDNALTLNRLNWTYVILRDDEITKVYLLDNRTSSWYYWELPIKTLAAFTKDNEALFVDYDGRVYRMTTQDIINEFNSDVTEYYDHGEKLIPWKWKTQILPFNTLNYSKRLISTTFMVTDTDWSDMCSLNYKFNVYRKLMTESDLNTIENKLNYILSTTKRTPIARFNFLQIELSNVDSLDHNKLKLVGLGLKYTLLGGLM